MIRKAIHVFFWSLINVVFPVVGFGLLTAAGLLEGLSPWVVIPLGLIGFGLCYLPDWSEDRFAANVQGRRLSHLARERLGEADQ